MSRRIWSITLTSEYLGKSKTIQGYSKQEVDLQATLLKQKWEDEVQRLQEREKTQTAKANKQARRERLREQAQNDTEEAQQLINAYKSLLIASLKMNHSLDWESLKKREEYSVPLPSLDLISVELRVPKEDKINEFLFPEKKHVRHAKEIEAAELFQKRLKEHGFAKQEFQQTQQEFNDSIVKFRKAFEIGTGVAIERYASTVLDHSQYPDGFDSEHEVQFEPISETVLVAFELPSKEELPRVTGYKYTGMCQ